MFGRGHPVVPGSRLEFPEAGQRLTGGEPMIGGNASLVECLYRGEPLLYKRFTPGYRDAVDAGALVRLVRWPRHLAPGDRQWLELHAAWPTHLVREDGVTVGLLLPMATPRYLRTDLDGRVAARTLLDLAGQSGADVVCGMGHTVQLALRLHRLGVYVADVRPENTLVDVNPVSHIMQVDCDSMVGGDWGRTGPPVLAGYLRELLPEPDRTDAATDLAKLAWCLILLLLGDYSVREVDAERRGVLARYLPESEVDFVVGATDPGRYTEEDSQRWAELSRRWMDRRGGGLRG